MATRQIPYRVEDGKGNLVEQGTYTVEVSTEQLNEETIRGQALAALTANRTYTALASPSTAQNTAQIKALSQQNNGIIRLLLGLLDGTN